MPPPFFLQLRSFVRLPGISPAGKPSPPAPFAASIAGQTRSRGDIAPGSRTGELAEAPARGAGRANASAGAGVVEQPGPGGDGRNGQPGSVRSARSHEADYPAETIVMQEADVGENEAAAMFEEVTGLGDGGVLNVNRRHVESVTLTPDAPVGPSERHNTVLRTLPPIAVAAAHSTAPHAAGGERGHARRARPTPR